MKLYLLKQDVSTGWDSYEAAVVCAANEEIARTIHPGNGCIMRKEDWEKLYSCGEWCGNAKQVNVQYLGEAATNIKQGLIISFYNEG